MNEGKISSVCILVLNTCGNRIFAYLTNTQIKVISFLHLRGGDHHGKDEKDYVHGEDDTDDDCGVVENF